jgi:hypothetical protein
MDHFQTHGWVRIEGAFSAQDAAAMRDVVWRALAAVGIQRDDPTTWRKERPDHLQDLKSDPAFRAVGSHLTLAAIDEVLGGQPWRRPSDWGAFFLVFPTSRPWNVPADGWHVDADYTGPLSPPQGREGARDVRRCRTTSRWDDYHQRLASAGPSLVPGASPATRRTGS